MQRILLMIIAWIMSTVCLYSQILPTLTEVELLKGKVKRIELQYSYPDTKHTSKTVSEYDILGRKTFTLDFYFKKTKKEYFSYDVTTHPSFSSYHKDYYQILKVAA